MNRKIKNLQSSELGVICKKLVKEFRGFFQSNNQRSDILKIVEEVGIVIDFDSNELWKELALEIKKDDKAIVSQFWNSRNGNRSCVVYVLDKNGVRMSFTAGWCWKKMEIENLVQKNNLFNAATVKNEEKINPGPDMHFFYSGLKSKFNRSKEVVNDK